MKTTARLHAALTFSFNEGKRVLSVTMMAENGGFRLLAIESSKKTFDSMLDSHAHKSLGWYRKFFDAIRVAEKYSEEWSAGARAKECACKEIPTKKRRR